MKIALCSSYVPFIKGGARNIVDWLAIELKKIGHEVERVYLPQIDIPDKLFNQFAAFRWVDLSAADRVICFRPSSYLVPHEHKILWFIHHIRVFYDLWDSPYRDFPDTPYYSQLRNSLHALDDIALREAKKIFTNSKIVTNRLQKYNNLESEILYPPIIAPEKFSCKDFNNEIVYVCRVEHHKRQHLLIEAMQYTKTPVKLKLYGASSSTFYFNELQGLISQLKLNDKVYFCNEWITEEHKIDILANCLAAAYIPLDEDSYGYPSLEAFHSSKPVITTSDSGGVLELVENDVNGIIAEPDPKALADAMDQLYIDRERTIRMGKNAKESIEKLNICWPHVLERLLA